MALRCLIPDPQALFLESGAATALARGKHGIPTKLACHLESARYADAFSLRISPGLYRGGRKIGASSGREAREDVVETKLECRLESVNSSTEPVGCCGHRSGADIRSAPTLRGTNDGGGL